LIEVVAEIIEKKRLPNVVVDPVIRSTSGYDLIDDEAVEALIERLLPLADVITPNMAEAERLTGSDAQDLDGMKKAARRIHEMSAGLKSPGTARRAVLVKGGHLEDEATDILFDGGEFHIFQAPKIATRDAHGTGCSLSSAIAALLARGCDIPEAVARAKRYLSELLRAVPDIGHGAPPLDHYAIYNMTYDI
jgi:hydroxymethylpyrimidine kinase/phosphomethylpyrimidine kinase